MEEKNKEIVIDGQQETMLLQDAQRAEYGEQIIKRLAKALTNRYGEGFTKTNLYNYFGFYKVQTLTARSPIRTTCVV